VQVAGLLMCRRGRIGRMGALPTSPVERNPVTPPSVVTGQGASTTPVSDTAAGFAVLEEAAPLPADLAINHEQEWTLRS